MKSLNIAIVIVVALIVTSCQKLADLFSPNEAPVVVIIAPQDGESFALHESVNIVASVNDSDGVIMKVEFYTNGMLASEDSSFPYSMAWNEHEAGDYELSVRALDNNDSVSVSETIEVTIEEDDSLMLSESESITENSWTVGSIDAGGWKLYRFSVTNNGKYTLSWNDSYDGSGDYNADIVVLVFDTNSWNYYLYYADSAYSSPARFTAKHSGDCFALVEGYYSFTEGSFAIKYRSITNLYKAYVKPNGNDSGEGVSASTAFKTLREALSRIEKNSSTIYLEKGTYPISDGSYYSSAINIESLTNIKISGGWDSAFTNISGKSVLDSAYTTLKISNSSLISIENIDFVGGEGYYAGGLYGYSSSKVNISNCSFLSNSGMLGGGLYLYLCNDTYINADFISNKAYIGGGVSLYYSSIVNVYGNILSNYASYDGGGIYMELSSYISNFAKVSYNIASQNGGGVCMVDINNTFLNSEISHNKSGSNGGGVYAVRNTSVNISSSLNSNTATNGGGVFLENSLFTSVGANMIGNTVNKDGGGLLAYNSASISISGIAQENSASYYGGSHALYGCLSVSIFGKIEANSSRYGSVFGENTTNIYISSVITNNELLSTQSGLLYFGDSNYSVYITNCVIGGRSNSGFAIYEKGELTNHIIKNNVFITNASSSLYRDYSTAVISNSDIGLINSVNSNHGALEASGNSTM